MPILPQKLNIFKTWNNTKKVVLRIKGESSIKERKKILDKKLKQLEDKKQQIQDSIDYINWKHKFYDDVLSGKTKYYSNLINNEKDDN